MSFTARNLSKSCQGTVLHKSTDTSTLVATVPNDGYRSDASKLGAPDFCQDSKEPQKENCEGKGQNLKLAGKLNCDHKMSQTNSASGALDSTFTYIACSAVVAELIQLGERLEKEARVKYEIWLLLVHYLC